MAASFRFLGPEGRPETIDFAESGGCCLVVKLARLSQISFFIAKVIDFKQGGGPLTGGRSEDGCVTEREAIIIRRPSKPST